MDINRNLKTPCNIYGICGYKQSGKNTVATIWQLLDIHYNRRRKNEFEKSYIEVIIEELKKPSLLKYLSDWIQTSFAETLKKITCLLFNCSFQDLENEDFKNSKIPESWKVWKINFSTEVTFEPSITEIFSSKEEALERYNELDNLDYWVCEPIEHLPTYREVLQHIGTDLFRNQLHPNWAINALFSDYHPKVVISSAYGNNYQEVPFDKNKKEHIDLWKGQQLKGLDNLGDNLPSWLITDVRFQNEADAITERGGKLIKVIRYKVGDKVWFNDEAGLYEDKNQSGEYEIIGIHSNEEYLISNGTTELGAWNYEINHINKDTHASEVEQNSIPVYYTIHNSTTLEDLIESVKYIMIEEGVIKV